jgi:hypothetical protein
VPFVNLKVPAIIIGLLLGIHKDATLGQLRCKEFFYLRQPGLVPQTPDFVTAVSHDPADVI